AFGGKGALVGIDEPPLPAAAEPDAAGLFQDLGELRVVGFLTVAGVQHFHVRAAPAAKVFGVRRVVRHGVRFTRRRNADGEFILAAGLFEERVHDVLRGPAAADDEERALFDDWYRRRFRREGVGARAVGRGPAELDEVGEAPGPQGRLGPLLAAAGGEDQ